jgi:hypothetical protein
MDGRGTRRLTASLVFLGATVLACGSGNVGATGTPASASQGVGSSAAVASPATGASPSVDLGPIPPFLAYRWIGDPRDVPVLGSSTRTGLNFSDRGFTVTGTNYGFDGILDSTAGTPSPREITLASTTTDGGCQIGDSGTYPWSISAGKTVLTIGPGVDACAARSALVPGTWARIACKNGEDGCLGDLEAGEHRSQYFAPGLADGETWKPDLGAMTYTVPSGWSNSSDWSGIFTLTPSNDYALEGPDGPTDFNYHQIMVAVDPAAVSDVSTCKRAEVTDPHPTVAALIAFLHKQSSVQVSSAHDITINGHSGAWVDLRLARSWTHSCPDSPAGLPGVDLLAQGTGGDDPWEYGLTGPERERMVFLDLGHGSRLMIVIDDTDPTKFDALVEQAMPIVASLRFH